MSDYTFHDLHDKDFEVLSCLLLSKREGVPIDRFKPGRDGGIDGRFFSPNKGKTIVQVKHWIGSGISALISHLKNTELKKVKKLKPRRYIIVTSLPLSLSDKEKIRTVFGKFIKDDFDVLGKENLNDMLSTNEDVFRSFPQLWIKNAAVLDSIVNRGIDGRSRDKLSQIVEKSSRYVVTTNHHSAFEVLQQKNVLIVTGEAGIGKTTLAEQVCLPFVLDGHKFYEISDDIKEAEDVFDREEKQVFFFDDFLGRNYLSAIRGSEDKAITRFIDRISVNQNKRFVLTSRSAIFSQGLFESDLLRDEEVKSREFQIVVGRFTKMEMARIVYDKVYFSDLPSEFLQPIYEDRRYWEIINHSNFNPRLVQQIFSKSFLKENVSASNFWSYVSHKLDNPQDIWRDVFDKQIDEHIRLLVLFVVLSNGVISENELSRAFKELKYASADIPRGNVTRVFRNSLEKAISAILNKNIEYETGKVTVSLFNPSVGDYVFHNEIGDADYIAEVLYSLKNESSLRVLRSLWLNDFVEKAYIVTVCQYIWAQFDPPKNKENLEYLLHLSSVAVNVWGDLDSSTKSKIVETVRLSGEFANTAAKIRSALAILAAMIGDDEPALEETEIAEVLVRFIPRIAQYDLHHDIRRMAEKIDDDVAEETLENLRSSIYSFFEEDLQYVVSNEGVLDDLLPGDEDFARTSLYDFLQDELSPYGIGESEIELLMERIDIDEILKENQAAYSEPDDVDDYRNDENLDYSWFDSEESKIDDLFSHG